MKKHPTIKKRIVEQLDANKKEAKLTLDDSPTAGINIQHIEKYIVLDASVVGHAFIKEMISKACEDPAQKIVITSVALKELDKLQSSKNTFVNSNSRFILSSAISQSHSFELITIDETYQNPDDCILEYCKKNPEQTVLWTADKAMYLKAALYSISSEFLAVAKVVSLPLTHFIKEQLCLSIIHTPAKSVLLYSNGVEYSNGIYPLSVGDEVFLTTKQDTFVTFAHYQVISLNRQHNAQILFKKTFYNLDDIQSFHPNRKHAALYRSFIKDFVKESHVF